MNKIILTIISFFGMIPGCFCQIHQEDFPVSFLYDLKTNPEVYYLKEKLSGIQSKPYTEISKNDTIEIFEPIIGELFKVSININTMGKWTVLENGDSIWQLQINSDNNGYMMLISDNFYLPQGTKLFVYSADRSQVLGAFTEKNNVPSNKFTTTPLKTNSLIIEYYKPHSVKEQAKFNIQSVGLISELFTNILRKNFEGSGSCMINAQCSEYDNWCNQQRSVALIIRVSSNSSEIRWCTGSLLTNERRDGKPLFLTAFHCLDNDGTEGTISQAEKDEIQNWLFIFNYQSPDCSDPVIEPSLEYSISGATYIRSHVDSDFALVQLHQKPPKNYNVYYNGWSNDNNITNTGVCIHHPSGDIKKISEWDKVLTLKRDFWKVKYTRGSTERGSSGSPLFDNSGYVVGQLFGGNASCVNNGHDFFGCFHRSWHKYGLSWELNPNGTHSGNYQYYLQAMNGDETCRENWHFNNCNDLHTSANVSFLDDPTIGTRQYDGVYNAKYQITAENTTIQSGTTVVFEAGNEIILKPGFHAELGCTFTAKIGDCQLGCNNGAKSSKKSTGNNYEKTIVTSMEQVENINQTNQQNNSHAN